jgi:hypothetical protein
LANLTTEQNVAFALLMATIFSLPSLKHILSNGHWRRLPLLMLILGFLIAGLWQARSWLPRFLAYRHYRRGAGG